MHVFVKKVLVARHSTQLSDINLALFSLRKDLDKNGNTWYLTRRLERVLKRHGNLGRVVQLGMITKPGIIDERSYRENECYVRHRRMTLDLSYTR